jgi:hypothetical protein
MQLAAKRGRTEVPDQIIAMPLDSEICKRMLQTFSEPWNSEAWRRALSAADKADIERIIATLEEKHLTVPQVATKVWDQLLLPKQMEEVVERHQIVTRFCRMKFITGYQQMTKPSLMKLANQILGSKNDMDA